jgi:hypothetical protein
MAQLEAFFDDDFDDMTMENGANSENEEETEHNSTADPEEVDPNPSDPKASDPAPPEGPNHRISDQFVECCAHMKQHCDPFSEDEKVAIKLLDPLRRKNAPLNACEDLLM